MKKLLLLISIFITGISASQSLELKGEVIQGGLIFGKTENVKHIKLDDTQIMFDSLGNFVIGFDRDDTTNHLLLVELEGKSILKNLIPVKRDYNIQRINRMQQKYVSPPKEVEDRIVRERKITKKAKENIGNIKNALFANGFTRPIKGGRISSVFGSQRILNGVPKSPHNGIDIAVPRGTPVEAMSEGKILLSADNFYYAGNFIIIDHGLGLNSLYLHLSESFVKEGQFVKKGEVIGKVGTTGRSTGPHLHWSVQWFDKRVDPNTVFSFNE
jgi:murein DD-endopeptidase MepM/ murein hydrolase activator NlpD